jgi:cation transport ATPase
MDVIISLEKLSMHPVAHALKEYAHKNGAKTIYDVDALREILGFGVEGHPCHLHRVEPTASSRQPQIRQQGVFEVG